MNFIKFLFLHPSEKKVFCASEAVGPSLKTPPRDAVSCFNANLTNYRHSFYFFSFALSQRVSSVERRKLLLLLLFFIKKTKKNKFIWPWNYILVIVAMIGGSAVYVRIYLYNMKGVIYEMILPLLMLVEWERKARRQGVFPGRGADYHAYRVRGYPLQEREREKFPSPEWLKPNIRDTPSRGVHTAVYTYTLSLSRPNSKVVVVA